MSEIEIEIGPGRTLDIQAIVDGVWETVTLSDYWAESKAAAVRIGEAVRDHMEVSLRAAMEANLTMIWQLHELRRLVERAMPLIEKDDRRTVKDRWAWEKEARETLSKIWPDSW